MRFHMAGKWLTVIHRGLLGLVRLLLLLLLLGSSIDDTTCVRRDTAASTCWNRDEIKGLWEPIEVLLQWRLGHPRQNLSTRNRIHCYWNDMSSGNETLVLFEKLLLEVC